MVEDTIHKDRYHQWLDTLTTNCQILYCCLGQNGAKRGLTHWVLKSGIDFGSLFKEGKWERWTISDSRNSHPENRTFSSLQFGLNSLPDPPWKESHSERPRREFLILQHTPGSVALGGLMDLQSALLMTFLCSKEDTNFTALFHEIGRIKTQHAGSQPDSASPFWCRIETSPVCTAMTCMMYVVLTGALLMLP